MKLQANIEHISIESNSYVKLNFKEEGVNYTGLAKKFVITESEKSDNVIVEKTQVDMTVTGSNDEVEIPLLATDTDYEGAYWYELWVDWGADKWQKEFKGNLNFYESANYNNV